jgi:tRNA C32,U32 (ribose-2'-O)-methylase TrmJ
VCAYSLRASSKKKREEDEDEGYAAEEKMKGMVENIKGILENIKIHLKKYNTFQFFILKMYNIYIDVAIN